MKERHKLGVGEPIGEEDAEGRETVDYKRGKENNSIQEGFEVRETVRAGSEGPD